MDYLCDDIIYLILQYMDCLKDILHFACVSNRLNLLLKTNYIWKYYFDIKYGEYISLQPFELLIDSYCRSIYIRYHNISLFVEKFDKRKSIDKIFRSNKLQITCKNMGTIPPEICYLINLRFIWLQSNKIISISPEICQLVNLQLLCLCSNQIESIPEEIGQLVNLRELNLDHNKITYLPPYIGRLINLRELWLSNNRIVSISLEIGQLINLQALSLSYNQIISIPREIGRLVKLQHLYLHGNPIKSIPEEIGQLPNLQNRPF